MIIYIVLSIKGLGIIIYCYFKHCCNDNYPIYFDNQNDSDYQSINSGDTENPFVELPRENL